MVRRLGGLLLLFLALASVGCCNCGGRTFCGGGGCGPLAGRLGGCGRGCGQSYCGDWISEPPCADPCNGCGGWQGGGGCAGGCGGGCGRPFCGGFLLRGLFGVRGDCGSCGGGCGSCGGGCSTCGDGSGGGAYAADFQGGGMIEQHPEIHGQMNNMQPQARSVMQQPTPAGTRTNGPSPTARKPIPGKQTGMQMPNSKTRPAGNVRLMSHEEGPAESTAAQTLSHRAAFAR